MTALFLPVSALVGALAGLISKKLFALIWGTVDSHEPPNHKQRVDSHAKLVLALVLEGALVRLLRGGLDHASRHGFARVTGAWPGEE
jgi:hypothetical protein